MSLSQSASTEPEIELKLCVLFLLFFVIFIHLFLTCFMFIVKHLVHVTLCCKELHFLHGRIYTNSLLLLFCPEVGILLYYITLYYINNFTCKQIHVFRLQHLIWGIKICKDLMHHLSNELKAGLRHALPRSCCFNAQICSKCRLLVISLKINLNIFRWGSHSHNTASSLSDESVQINIPVAECLVQHWSKRHLSVSPL